MRDDPLEMLLKLTEENTCCKNIQKHLIELIESLYKDLQQKTNVVESSQKQLQSLLKQETFGITSKYVALKEKYEVLNKEMISLKNENDDLHTQLITKDEQTKKLLLEKEEEMQLHHMKEIKQKEELLKYKEEELRTAELNHQKTQQELYNEMQAAEASFALQLDQAESNFRRQLNEVSKKLKESADTCNILRNELFNTKEQFNECKSKIVELQRQLRESHRFEYAYRHQETSSNNSVVEESPVSEKNNANLYSKYQPLEINQKNLLTSTDKPLSYKKTPVFRSGAKYLEEDYSTPRKNNSVPPLMRLSTGNNSKDDKNVNKKRKLYNPDDLGYLNLGEEESDK